MHKWPDWHNKYPFNDFYIYKFAPSEPGVFYIFNYENFEILYFGYSENIKEKLLNLYENPNNCLNKVILKGSRLGFSYFKAQNPQRFYLQILESFNKLYKSYPKCQE